MAAVSLQKNNDKLLLKGELTFTTVNSLNGENLFAEVNQAVIDLSEVTRSDSSGLALLIEWFRQAEKAGVKVTFENVPQKMMALAKVSNLDKVLPLVSH